MVTSPTSLNPPTNRRSISIDDYQPASPPPQQSSSSESDNDENEHQSQAAKPTRKPRRKAPRKSASSLSLDSLDRDELTDETLPPRHLSPPPKRPRAEPLKQKEKQGVQEKEKPTTPEEPATPVTASPEMEPDEPISDDNLINVSALQSADGHGWDRFIFFSHRPQRHVFPEDCYLSDFSPFSAVASAMGGLTTRSVCAVCGAGGSMKNCIRCPLAFHLTCVDPMKSLPTGDSWMCPACHAAKNGHITLDWHPQPGRLPPPLPDPSTGLKRLIMDTREGNPVDMVFSPSLFSYYKSIAGSDWLRCTRCRRIRLVKEGVLSEAVRIPFECPYAFWIELVDRRCDPPSQQRLYEKTEQRVIQYIRSRKTQRQLLFRFGFDEVDAVDYGKPNLENMPVLRPVKPKGVGGNGPAVSPMEISPAKTQAMPPRASVSGLPQVQGQVASISANGTGVTNAKPTAMPDVDFVAARKAQPVKPAGPQRTQPQAVVGLPPRQVVPSPAQQIRQQAVPDSVPQSPGQITPQASVVVPVQTTAPTPMQVSPAIPVPAAAAAAAAEPANGVAKPEPLVNASGQNTQQELLTFIASLEWEEWVEDALTDLALANNKKLTQLYVAFHSLPQKFQRQATRLAQREKGDMRPQAQAPVQSLQPPPQAPRPQPPQQPQPMQIQTPRVQIPQQAVQMQTTTPQRLPQPAVDVMFRQMAIRHVREIQDLEQTFMRRMEQVPATQVAELMGMKDITIAKLKHRQEEDRKQFYQTHGLRG